MSAFTSVVKGLGERARGLPGEIAGDVLHAHDRLALPVPAI
jgi:hypothetical protein